MSCWELDIQSDCSEWEGKITNRHLSAVYATTELLFRSIFKEVMSSWHTKFQIISRKKKEGEKMTKGGRDIILICIYLYICLSPFCLRIWKIRAWYDTQGYINKHICIRGMSACIYQSLKCFSDVFLLTSPKMKFHQNTTHQGTLWELDWAGLTHSLGILNRRVNI